MSAATLPSRVSPNTECQRRPGANRFARGFIRGVATFLLITALLKLLGVASELPALGTSDPMLPLLTLRQSTLLAALLELAVGAWLFRGGRPVMALGVIVWLSTLFFFYHAGRWLIGFRGPCPCLGVAPFYCPLNRLWIDWVSPTALMVMGMGSIYLLTSRLHNRGESSLPAQPMN